jgi:hypothetical protein
LERVENGKFVSRHGLKLVHNLSVVLVNVLAARNSDVDTKNVELNLLLPYEVKEVLELGALDSCSELCDDQLELNN